MSYFNALSILLMLLVHTAIFGVVLWLDSALRQWIAHKFETSLCV